jgi:hypothetical protein
MKLLDISRQQALDSRLSIALHRDIASMAEWYRREYDRFVIGFSERAK